MSKEDQYFNSQPTPPPHYHIRRASDRMRSQHTGSSKTAYEHELDDIHGRQDRPPQDHEDAHRRWRRGIENDMSYQSPKKSRGDKIFATCCCGSIWGIVAWIVVLLLLIGGFTALLVKVLLPHDNHHDISGLSASTVTLTSQSLPTALTATSAPSPAMSTFTTIATTTTSPEEPSAPTLLVSSSAETSVSTFTSTSTATTTATSIVTTTVLSISTSTAISVSTSISTLTYTPPTTPTITQLTTVTPPSQLQPTQPTPQTLTSHDTTTAVSTATSTSVSVSTSTASTTMILTYKMKTSDTQQDTATVTEHSVVKTTVFSTL